MQGARYAHDDDKNSWFVVQLFGTWLCDAKGVVLLLDKRTGVWRTIYNVPSGCSYDLNYPLRGMLIEDNQLYVSACKGGTECMYHGEYHELSFDLSTNMVTALEFGSSPVGTHYKENPVMTNVLGERNLK